uniref:Uncharacterized protein n=1 Tax=Sexangularia sp. CB-2014 TaxID=1486929 RepID=A0A7S1VP57_9EUKA|mmetsp:Transcript_7326/g.23440  ORF Transcript_7326/g.23440 Transcript_7326/m.23440 type:complete len:238 (+) Transcript_7326:126-839(+)|eukprot:CAMPEP_0170747196 /NCGR_PEP_ID=MMETSP0437-20130122/9196_1 /TAXON_ID=0 /ORGANISM="Sexangularia sp." /LENGTH=237 /DNA_ID=CAMNT_0011085963 /DNA_START=15 /DNA_END=728 /DNA_ORIENTATION=-
MERDLTVADEAAGGAVLSALTVNRSACSVWNVLVMSSDSMKNGIESGGRDSAASSGGGSVSVSSRCGCGVGHCVRVTERSARDTETGCAHGAVESGEVMDGGDANSSDSDRRTVLPAGGLTDSDGADSTADTVVGGNAPIPVRTTASGARLLGVVKETWPVDVLVIVTGMRLGLCNRRESDSGTVDAASGTTFARDSTVTEHEGGEEGGPVQVSVPESLPTWQASNASFGEKGHGIS